MPEYQVFNYKACHVANAVDKINGKKYQYSFLKPTKIDF